MSTAIKVENLSKAYQLGQIGTGTISRDLERWWALKRGKEDPFLKIGEANDRTAKGESDIVWSLKDLDFEIKQGDAVGIIGRNGAGKSTLLKLLSQVTSPTTGKVKVRGRIASLLEVGTGFHPDLSGKENIFLNGAILGMRRSEIKRKFDEIVQFAGVERYTDTPVKRYSSGMYVRLAFAVAAHLESEILIVDEVLAVGDVEFQSKCLGKMDDVSKRQGRTVLFVSHNMSSIKSLCENVLYLKNGRLLVEGDVDQVTSLYLKTQKVKGKREKSSNSQNYVSEIFLADSFGNPIDTSDKSTRIFLYVKLIIHDDYDVNFGFTVVNDNGNPLFSASILNDLKKLKRGESTYKIEIPVHLLKSGSYSIEGSLWRNNEIFDSSDNYCSFDVISASILEMRQQGIKGLIINPNSWMVQ